MSYDQQAYNKTEFSGPIYQLQTVQQRYEIGVFDFVAKRGDKPPPGQVAKLILTRRDLTLPWPMNDSVPVRWNDPAGTAYDIWFEQHKGYACHAVPENMACYMHVYDPEKGAIVYSGSDETNANV